MNLTEVLGIKYPIIQGAMAQIATADLAAAVSNACWSRNYRKWRFLTR